VIKKVVKKKVSHQSDNGSGNDELAEARRRAKEWRREQAEGDIYKMLEGDNILRILNTPADKARKSPAIFVEYLMHGSVGPKKRFLRCGHTIKGGGKCWLCDVQIPKIEDKRPEDAAEMAPKPQIEFNTAIFDSDTNKFRGPKRLCFSSGGPKSIGFKVQGIVVNDRKNYLDHKKGYNFTITRFGTGRNNTSYDITSTDDEPSAVPASIVAKLKPFADTVPEYDEERMKNAYFGREEETNSDGAGKKKAKSYEAEEEEAVEADSEEEEVEEEEAEEAEEEVEEEEAEEEEAEEEEEEAPKPRKKPVAKPVAKKRRAEEEEEEEVEEEESEEEEVDEDADEEAGEEDESEEAEEEVEEDDAEEEEPEEEEPEEEEEAPKPRKLKKPVAKKVVKKPARK
jgi:hypothetical protein